MPYVTSSERLAKEEGREQGRVEEIQANVAAILEVKFGAAGKRPVSKVRKMTDVPELRDLLQAIVKADSVAEVRPLIPR